MNTDNKKLMRLRYPTIRDLTRGLELVCTASVAPAYTAGKKYKVLGIKDDLWMVTTNADKAQPWTTEYLLSRDAQTRFKVESA